MPLPRIVPRRVFQVYALATLALAWALVLEIVVTGSWPMSALAPLVGLALGALATWMLVTVVWMLVVLPVRLVTDFPTLAETLSARGAGSLGEAIAAERAKLRSGSETPSERRRRHALFAVIGAVLAVAFLLAAAANVELMPDHVLLFPPVVALVSALFAAFHGLRALLTYLER